MSVLTRTLRHQLNSSSLSRITRAAANRTMASTAAEKFEWLVVVPDHPGALAQRLEVRPKHFEGLAPNKENGFWQMGGAILDDVPKEGEQLKFRGSAMVASASSKEEVLEILKNDIYTKSGVWDLEKIQIYPFKCAFRVASS